MQPMRIKNDTHIQVIHPHMGATRYVSIFKIHSRRRQTASRGTARDRFLGQGFHRLHGLPQLNTLRCPYREFHGVNSNHLKDDAKVAVYKN